MRIKCLFILFGLFGNTLFSQIQELKPISCHGGSDGALMVIPTSTMGPYTYLWSPYGQTTQSIWNIPAGTYSVTVVDDTNGVFTYSYELNEPSPITVTVIEVFPNNCDGYANGGIIGIIAGGTPPHQVTWRGIEFDSIYTSFFLMGVRGGYYELTVQDSMGCVYKDTFLVPTLDTVKVDVQVNGYVCNGEQGSAVLTALEADTGYYFTFQWSTPQQGLQQFTTNDSIFSVSMQLYPGNYTITVTDVQTGCQRYVPVTIRETQAPLVVSWTKQDNECFQLASGQISLQVHGGDPSYTVSWTGPNGFSSTAFSIAGLESGTYTYLVRDSIACRAQGMVTIEPTPPFCIPNFVSPNGDGINDVFEISDLCNASNINLYIYDMSGKLVFSSTDCSFSWNPIDAGASNHTVYYYHLTYTYQQQTFEKKGTIDVKY